jgi:CubicO group peptidase (beta-lactamase class C family)
MWTPRTRSVAIAVIGACLVIALGARCGAQAAPPGPASTPADADLAPRLAAIEKALEARRQEHHVPGAALVIVKDDRVIFMKGFGLRDVERKLPVTPETLFAIGSTSKAFTALAVLMSAEEGKLSLWDSPKKYLRYFKLRDAEADSKITISDLLCHRSGLSRTDIAWYTGVLRPKEVIQVAGQVQPTAKLGEKFQYQNVMFLAAGEIVAQVQQTSWHNVMKRRIFQPLGMSATDTSARAMQRARDHALGYNYDADTKQSVRLPMRDLTNIAPAGAINSSVQDLAQWLRMLLNGGAYADRRLVSANGFKELFVKRIEMAPGSGYGYGWVLGEWNGRKIAQHGGGIDGFNAQVALMPDQRLGFALLTNISSSPLPQIVTNLIWENLVGSPKKPAEESADKAAPSVPAVDPAAEVGTYHLEAVKLDAVVALKDGKLMVRIAGQPDVTLENVGGRRYKVNPPAPPGLFVTFRPTRVDAKETELFFEQPGGVSFALSKQKPTVFTAPLSVEALMQKVIDAAGGEANLRKHRAMVTKFTLDLENQGLTGKGLGYARAPNALAETWTLYGVGRKIATVRDYCDGTQGCTESSFSPTAVKTGRALEDATLAASFHPELDWRTLFKSVTIQGLSKLGDEEVYQVVKTPEKGSPVTDYVSTHSFRVLKRSMTMALPGLAASVPVSETFSDYRAVDGVLVPFTRVRSVPEFGNIVVTVKEVKFDGRVPDAAFRPRAQKK